MGELPNIGDRYTNVDGATFIVVGLDEDGGFVEVQYADGTLEELDLDDWDELGLAPADREHWSETFPEAEEYDLNLDDSGLDWADPLDDFEG